MGQLEEHECYCCGSYGPYMTIVAGTEEGNLWWCNDPAWCRARAVAEKLKNDPRMPVLDTTERHTS